MRSTARRPRRTDPGAIGGREPNIIGVAAVLFLSLFAAQAAVIVLSPVLAGVAADFEVSTAMAGQLRTLSGLAAGATALAIPAISRRYSLRGLLLGGAWLIATASVASAAAPSLVVIAAAQVVLGVAVATVTAAGTAAVAAWAPEGTRTQVLSWALIGPPAAWIVGMPIVGVLGGVSWRLGWLALPLVAAIAAALMLLRRPRDAAGRGVDARLRQAVTDPAIGRWALAELLASSGWTGTLVYAGALFTESYGTSAALTGVALAVGAAAYVGGNFAIRRFSEQEPRQQLVALAVLLALGIPAFGSVRPGVWTSAVLFAAVAFVAGGRTLVANAFGLSLSPEQRVAAVGIRTAATQFGYFAGSGAAGLALAMAGYTGLGVTQGLFFLGAALVLAEVERGERALATSG
jgi:predicted MFS family arabinose efflux permease